MIVGIIALLLTSVPSVAQEHAGQPASTGNANTTGPCSPAITGSHNTVNYSGENCLSALEEQEIRAANSHAYARLDGASRTFLGIQSDWKQAIGDCSKISLGITRRIGPGISRIIQERYHYCVLDSQKEFQSKWKTMRPSVVSAIDEATKSIVENEERKLATINLRKAWKKDFDQTWGPKYSDALARADRSFTVEDLIDNDVDKDGNTNRDRDEPKKFDPLMQYMKDLTTKLGDYRSQ